MRIMTLNVERDVDRKIEHTLKYALAEVADVGILTETCEGAAIQSICSKHGFTVFATGKDCAGVTILIRDQWADSVADHLNVIETGRCMSCVHISAWVSGDPVVLDFSGRGSTGRCRWRNVFLQDTRSGIVGS